MMKTPEELLNYLESKIERITESGCWIWMSSLRGKDYGFMSFGERRVAIHRVAYELFVSPIPAGLDIDHLCRVHCCLNPAHLEPVTRRENTLRGIGPTAQSAKKTHCRKGHSYSGDNLRITLEGFRKCRACDALRKRILRSANQHGGL